MNSVVHVTCMQLSYISAAADNVNLCSAVLLTCTACICLS